MIATELATVNDAEAVVRAWLRSAVPALSGRVFFSIPNGPTYPLVVVSRTGGLPDTDLPVDYPDVQMDVWSSTGKLEAAQIAYEIVGLCRAVKAEPITFGSTVTRIEEARVTMGPLWRPDGDAGLARYIVDAQFTLIPEQ